MPSYSVLRDCFYQTKASTDRLAFNFLDSSFGVLPAALQPADGISTGLTGWQHLRERIDRANNAAPKNTCYKVIYLARHGQGVHNVAESKYGTAIWDETFSKLDGADGMEWADARLTVLGEQQARDAARLWAQEAASQGMPVPEIFYSSPFIRCLQTARIMHAGPEWDAHGARRYNPVVKECLRETNGVHTCDRRSPRSVIAAQFPEVAFESSFSEQDELWDADQREHWAAQDKRLKACLDAIFDHENHVWISITAHSGAGRAILKAFSYPREWRLEPGEVLPIAIRISSNRDP